jgi:hypothetical protein
VVDLALVDKAWRIASAALKNIPLSAVHLTRTYAPKNPPRHPSRRCSMRAGARCSAQRGSTRTQDAATPLPDLFRGALARPRGRAGGSGRRPGWVSQAAGPARERATVAAVRRAARARGAPRARGICRRVSHARHEDSTETHCLAAQDQYSNASSPIPHSRARPQKRATCAACARAARPCSPL